MLKWRLCFLIQKTFKICRGKQVISHKGIVLLLYTRWVVPPHLHSAAAGNHPNFAMRRKPCSSGSVNPRPRSLPSIKKHRSCPNSTKSSKPRFSYSIPTEKHRPSPPPSIDFSALPYDVLVKIAAAFALPNLRAASLVCRAWRDALRPLREAMVLLIRGKRFKHGRGGVSANPSKALDSFLKGAARGSTFAMVDAGMMYWEMGEKQEAVAWYRKAARLGDPAGQCNLAISILQDDPQSSKEAIELLFKASIAGHVRAQYQLALSFHQGQGVKKCPQQAARWYQKAAQGGYVRAMYNTSLCYLLGEGFWPSHSCAMKWMKRAADFGHTNAQFEHGLTLFSQGDLKNAVVYLELATRSGQKGATHVKNTILQQLSVASRAEAMLVVDRWVPLGE